MSFPRRRPLAPLLGVALALMLPTAACGGSATDTATGQGLYAEQCARCHGPTLRGTEVGPPLIASARDDGALTDADIREAIREGIDVPGNDFVTMPAIRGLSREQVAAIVSHVRDVEAGRVTSTTSAGG